MEENVPFTVTVAKSSVDSKVGITIAAAGGHFFVSKIRPGSPFVQSRLKPGQVLLKVNDILCDKAMNLEGVLNAISNAYPIVTLTVTKTHSRPDGSVYTANDDGSFTETIRKKDQDSKVGLTFEEVNGQVYIARISDDSPFAGTRLQVGNLVCCVNKRLGTKSSAEFATKCVSLAYPTVQVTVRKYGAPAPEKAPHRVDAVNEGVGAEACAACIVLNVLVNVLLNVL